MSMLMSERGAWKHGMGRWACLKTGPVCLTRRACPQISGRTGPPGAHGRDRRVGPPLRYRREVVERHLPPGLTLSSTHSASFMQNIIEFVVDEPPGVLNSTVMLFQVE